MATPKINGDDAAVTNGTVPTPKVEATPNTTSPFPPPKTDKPRPHVCQTCGRSFARLEHLKRHERSHTKEKPFECPQCTRCFARRDLLLRHQQKLHQAGAASSRPRGGRRESASGVQPSASTRVRKNSIASSVASVPSTSTMRPRANTISHIDGATLMLLNQHSARSQVPPFGHHQSLNAMPGQGNFDMRAMTMFGNYNGLHPLPKIETNGLGLDLGGGLKTAPISMMGEGYDVDKMFSSASTVNPAQLHFGGAIGTPGSPFNQGFPSLSTGVDDDESFDWTGGLGDTLMSGTDNVAVDGSSPSAISTGSQSGFSEVMVDGSNNMTTSSSGLWPNSIMVTSSQFTVDPVSAAVFPELVQQTHTVSPKDLHDHNSPENLLFSNPQQYTTMSPTSNGPNITNQFFQPALTFGSDTTSMSSTSASGSGPQSSVTTMSTDSITDATRQALLYSLSQPTGFGHTGRKYSQPSISSPLSPPYGSRQPANSISLPSTADLQRYVNAYIHYFHPHMPFLHVATLSFDSPVFTANMRAHHSYREGIVGGGGCLILAMAAIGASYEFEHKVAKDLFEYAKRIISIYLEERRKASASMPSNVSGNHASAPAQRTPLWLVQAMLLNLIYGHQCGDRIAAEIATTHCAALVGLAKAADLENPDPDVAIEESRSYTLRNGPDADVDMGDESRSRSWRRSTPHDSKEEHSEWFRWKSKEERKRTLLSVFVLSSLLVTAYNHQPKILNSELHVDLPCEENLWGADSAKAWITLGGLTTAKSKAVSFADALTFLLTASMRQQSDNRLSSPYQAFGSSVPLEQLPQSELKPSTFGCYILINALHVYIWETRQRHQGRQWKTQETEQMHAQVEPALRAWQAAWRANPNHNLERPNPYGPLPADSIPLLDLAYVRLFVNLGRSKEAFWLRDFEAMADELGSGAEIIQHAEDNSRETSEPPEADPMANNGQPQLGRLPTNEIMLDMIESPEQSLDSEVVPGFSFKTSSKRERHLRKAAFYAADSLSMADKLGATFAEFTSRELPIQAAMCTFDCAQVLAEWIATVQARCGRYLGVIGRDHIDFTQVPSVMLLEDEDCKLLDKVNEILDHADVKIAFDAASMGTSPEAILGPLKNAGYGSRLLLTTAYMLDKAAVWGITRIMARSMRIHAEFLKERAEASTNQI